MRRFRTLIAIFLAVSLTAGITADAGWDWCEDDPIVTIDGRQFQMITGFPASQLDSLKGPVRYVVEIPSNAVNVTVEYPPSTVPSKAYIVRSLDEFTGTAADAMTVRVSVTVMATAEFGFVTRVFGQAVKSPFSVDGKSNKWSRFKVSLSGQ